MRILHLISSGGMYGAEAVILNLSRTLNEQGHTSLLGIFANSSNPNLQLHERALAEGIESHLIPCNGQLDRSVPASIRSLVTATSADVIHAHGYKADVYAWLALRKTTTALVSTCHTWYDDNPLLWLYGAIDRRVLRQYAAVVSVSDDVTQRLLASGVAPDRVHFVRNGIDLRPFTNATPSLRQLVPPEGLLVGWIGRLTHDKGPDVFLRAVAQLRPQFPQARFVLVGEGPYRPEVERLLTGLALTDVVHLLGQRQDMPNVYASCDVLVSSSRQEGLPMAILEGMASARPWVATAVGAVPLVFPSPATGLLVPSENVELLAENLARLLHSSEQRSAIGAAAKQRIELEFSAKRMTVDYLSVYTTACANHLTLRGDVTEAAQGGTT